MSDLGPTGSSITSNTPPLFLQIYRSATSRSQQLLDQSVPHTTARWIFLSILLLIYLLRVYTLEGFYIVTYGLGIFLLNLLIGFLSPLDEDSLESTVNSSNSDSSDSSGPLLPTSDTAEFKPFIRRLPEFKFWLSCFKAIIIGLLMTLFSIFDVPVFWPILLIYFIILFVLTMKRQIKHMIKHKYLPFNIGKKKYQKGGINSNTANNTNTGNSNSNNTAGGGLNITSNRPRHVAEDIRSR